MDHEYDSANDSGFDDSLNYDVAPLPLLKCLQNVLPDDPLVRVSAVITVVIYTITFVVGIPANIYVLFRMRRLALYDVERYRNGTGVALCSMAAADLCSLLLIMLQNVQQMTIETPSDPKLRLILCKSMLFLTHTVTGISIWSWLLLSSLRYLAICHPLYHLRLWQMPYRALAFIITSLMKNSLMANRLLQTVECVWSFCIPCAVIVVMDTSVVLKSTSLPCLRLRKNGKHKRRKSALEEIIMLTRSNSGRAKARQQKALCRWLIIALVCVLLNTPENSYRLIMLLQMPEFDENVVHYSARMLAQALYFSQFAFNAIYLALFVYDKSSRSKHVHDGSNYNSHDSVLVAVTRAADSAASETQQITVLPPLIRSRRASTCDSPPALAAASRIFKNQNSLSPAPFFTTSRSFADLSANNNVHEPVHTTP